MSLEPIEGCGEAEDAYEAGGCLLVTCRDGAPYFQPRPEALDHVAVGVDPVRACYGRFIAFGGDCWSRAHIPHVLPKGVAGIASVGNHPPRHSR